MHPARIAELLQPFLSPISNSCHSEPGQRPSEEPAVLSATQLQSISMYIDILRHWNARINLTAIRNEEEIVTRHFGESLFAASHLFPLYPVPPPVPSVVKDFDSASDSPKARAADSASGALYPVSSSVSPVASVAKGVAVAVDLPRVADLGSGAGFPGIPIKLWAPKIALTLIESNQKKSTFLREISRALTLTNINIQNTRAETLPPETFDVVTIRAVERLAEVLPVAAALLAPAGRLALLIAASQLDQVQSTLPTLAWQPPIPVPESRSRLLLVGSREPRE
jgi:16S rRNA (guanine527-N7)-methyltransferase